MAMNGMGPNCPMNHAAAGSVSHGMASSDCPQNCCGHAFSQAMAPGASSDKLRLIVAAAAFAQPGLISFADPLLRPLANLQLQFSFPPRYVLNQVFRI